MSIPRIIVQFPQFQSKNAYSCHLFNNSVFQKH